MASFKDNSTECAICLGPFKVRSDGNDNDKDKEDDGGNNSSDVSSDDEVTITLRCGHRYHLKCIIEQIEVGSVKAKNDDQRLLFSGIQCAKCCRIFNEDDHPDLPKDLIRATDKLRSDIDKLIVDQNLLPSSQQQNAIEKLNEQEREALFREARRKYAFYLCSHCDRVYFGGTVECADDGIPPPHQTNASPSSNNDNGNNNGGNIPVVPTTSAPEKRLCPACIPQQSQTICSNPIEHGRYLTWKCRYCCKPSTHVCYGGVHFCDSCHEKNSLRVAFEQQQQQQRNRDNNNNINRPVLEAIPCTGESCCYPKPRTHHGNNMSEYHKNGSTQDCEQVYSCAICDSSNRRNDVRTTEPGSRNFVYNPSGELGLRGWRRATPRNTMMWQVEQRRQRFGNDYIPEEPILYSINNNSSRNNNNNNNSNSRNPITTNFVSSFRQCAMVQSLDLTRLLRLGSSTLRRRHNNNNNEDVRIINDDTIIPIEISARYTGRDDCPSVFMMQSILSDHVVDADETVQPDDRRRRRRNNERLTTAVLEAPPGNYWERATLTHRLSMEELNTGFVGRPVITVLVFGQDTRFWQGNFGSKVADITVRVLGDPSFIDAVVIPQEEVRNDNANGTGDRNVAYYAAAAAGVDDRRTTAHNRILWDFIVPVVCFVILAWLTK